MNVFIKTLFSLIILSVIIIFSSCKDDSFDPLTIRGVWTNEEWGGKSDPDYSKIETYQFDKFDIGMYYLEEFRRDTLLNSLESSFEYSLFENTITITFSDGSVRVRNVSIDKDILIMAGDTTKVYNRIH